MVARIGPPSDVARRWLTTYAFVAAAVLVLGGVIGYGVAALELLDPSVFLSEDSQFLPEEITFQYIVVNNLVAITVTLLGAVSVGTLTVFVLLLNGFVVGFVVQLALQETTALEVFLLVAPHGILEIPAILIVSAIGLRFGHRTYRYVRGREEALLTEREIVEAGVLYFVAVVLIVVAAWIEAEYTIAIAESVGG